MYPMPMQPVSANPPGGLTLTDPRFFNAGTGPHILIRALPKGISVRGHWFRSGTVLHATVHVQAFGSEPQTIFASFDLRPLLRRAVKRARDRYGATGNSVFGFGFLKKIARAVAKIGKSAIVKSIVNGVKSVAKSKLVGAAIGGLAVVFPPVGVPAAAAYAAVNTGIKALEAAEKLKNTAQNILAKGPAGAIDLLKDKVPLLKEAEAKANFVRRQFGNIANLAQKGNPQAKAMASIVASVVKHRGRVHKVAVKAKTPTPTKRRALPPPRPRPAVLAPRPGLVAAPKAPVTSLPVVPGLLVTTGGKIVPGRFLLQSAAKI